MSSATGLNDGECGLTDGSVQGDWRLATKEELQGIGTDPPTTWSEGTSTVTWTKPGAPFVGVGSNYDYYWSSIAYDFQHSWAIEMGYGDTVFSLSSYSIMYVWPVRDDT